MEFLIVDNMRATIYNNFILTSHMKIVILILRGQEHGQIKLYLLILSYFCKTQCLFA